jgi:phosphoglycolate phosphatase-like HAD superfamily hydrolase
MTNAPPTGIRESLDVLGLAEAFDEVCTGARKPSGFADLIPALLRGAPPPTLMSVGDVWVNDIEPPLAAGCATALVARHDDRPAHLHGSLPSLYGAIDAWVTDPACLPRLASPEIPS